MIFAKNGFWMFIESLDPEHNLNVDSLFIDCLVRKIMEEMKLGNIDVSPIIVIKPEDELEREAGSMSITTIPIGASDLDEAQENYTVNNVPLSDVYEVGIENALSDGYVILCEDLLTAKLEEAESYGEDIADTQLLWEEHNVEPDVFVYIDKGDGDGFGYSRKFLYEQITSLRSQDPHRYVVVTMNEYSDEICSALWDIFEQNFSSRN